MRYKVKVTVIDKKLFPELQQQYCMVPDSGKCPCYNVGDEFMFYRDIDCSIYSEDVLTLIGHLDSEPMDFTFLGSYLEV